MLIVKKFGGTSVGNRDRIFNVANRCIEDYKKGNDVVVVLSAMGQAFFSLSVGIGCLATYASYFQRDVPLVSSAFSVCFIDTLVAILSGFIIFPAVFSVSGVEVDAGPGLVFITLPNVFNMAFGDVPVVGYLFSGLFYILLLLAALTSSISMHEIDTAFLHEKFHLSRRHAASVVTAVCLVRPVLFHLVHGKMLGFLAWDSSSSSIFSQPNSSCPCAVSSFPSL